MNDPHSNIKHHLNTLKLREIDRNLDDVMARALTDNLPTSTVLEQLFSYEASAMIDRRIERRIKESKLPERKLLADFDFEFQDRKSVV